jgi:hypothetical protein
LGKRSRRNTDEAEEGHEENQRNPATIHCYGWPTLINELLTVTAIGWTGGVTPRR